jgi:ribosomal-protein-alanine N-acetyltransferase
MTPVYETPRLLVRRWTLDDLEAFHGLFGDKRMWRYLPSDPPASIDESLAMMQRMLARMQEWDGYGSFAAVRHADGLIIGNALLRPLENGPEIEVGYHFAVPHWGNGYATEIARGAVRYGFENLRLDEIYGVVVQENIASRRVLEKAGLIWIRRDRHFGIDCDVLRISRSTADR